jgi:hypothetical protein
MILLSLMLLVLNLPNGVSKLPIPAKGILRPLSCGRRRWMEVWSFRLTEVRRSLLLSLLCLLCLGHLMLLLGRRLLGLLLLALTLRRIEMRRKTMLSILLMRLLR